MGIAKAVLQSGLDQLLPVGGKAKTTHLKGAGYGESLKGDEVPVPEPIIILIPVGDQDADLDLCCHLPG